MQAKDLRIKIINEIIAGIKVELILYNLLLMIVVYRKYME